VPLGASIALSVVGLAGPAAGLAAFRAGYLVLAVLVACALGLALLTLRPTPAMGADRLSSPL
jgi:hypothetical protein